jgi:hypothetical protein
MNRFRHNLVWIALISDGLRTIVDPAAIAVATLEALKPSVLFHGMIAATTPSGSSDTSARPILHASAQGHPTDEVPPCTKT